MIIRTILLKSHILVDVSLLVVFTNLVVNAPYTLTVDNLFV